MNRRILSCILILAVCVSLLSGCGGKNPPAASEAPTLPEIRPGEPASWDDPGGPTDPLQDPSAPSGRPDPDNPVPGTDAPAPTTPSDPAGENGGPGAGTGSFREDSPENLIRPSNGAEELPCGLEQELEQLLDSLDGEWSLYLKNLDTRETVSLNDRPMAAASLIKLFVAGACYATDPDCEDPSRCGLVRAMISSSSNEACNQLIDLLGRENINDFIRARGCKNTVLNRKMLEQSAEDNYTSARECGEVLEAVLREEYVSPAASRELLSALKAQERTGKLPAGVPNGVETANKTGELADVENDACIVWSDGGVYVLCVLASDLNDAFAARETFAEISRTVYRFFNER